MPMAARMIGHQEVERWPSRERAIELARLALEFGYGRGEPEAVLSEAWSSSAER
jgi:hypothetical protein